MATHFRLEKFCLNPHIVDITSDFHLKGIILSVPITEHCTFYEPGVIFDPVSGEGGLNISSFISIRVTTVAITLT